MTRSMYLSRSRSEATTSRVVRSWIESLGTGVVVSALAIIVEIALKDNVVSFPPKTHQHCSLTLNKGRETFQNCSIPRLYCQRRYVCDDLWPCLKNYEEYSNRASDSLEL